jgi:hypothetical protein
MQALETVELDIRQLLQNEQLAVLSTEQQGQPYASLLAFAVTCTNTGSRNDRRSKLIWVQRWPGLRRCYRAVLYMSGKTPLSCVGT